jgi:hypothetical protein
MKAKQVIARVLCVLTLLMLHLPTTDYAQGTAFTYQGSLNDATNPANGIYDLRFALCPAASGGVPLVTFTNAATSITNGLFTVTLDFGAVFAGSSYWLELAVRTNGGVFTALAPRQQITPTPYAIYSANASSAATAVTANSANFVAATNIVGAISFTQLPAGVVTNNNLSALVLTNPNNIVYNAWNPAANNKVATPPKGINCWYSTLVTNEKQVVGVVSNMVASGMVNYGYNTFSFDAGPPTPGIGEGDSPFPLVTNSFLYPALTNSGWLDFDPAYYPHGAQWLISMMHSNGVKCILYTFNGAEGGTSGKIGTNIYVRVQPGAFGTAYWQGWLSNAIVNWKIDGLKDEVSAGNYVSAIQQQSLVASLTARTGSPFYVNVATLHGFQPWFSGLFNSWRIGVGIYGDVGFLGNYYLWLDMTPFWVTTPGGFNDLDEMSGGNSYWIAGSLFRNELAMDSMANTALLMSPATSEKNDALRAGYYYSAFDNPLVNGIDNDLTYPVQLASSNNLLLTYTKQLKDGTYVVCVQNRSSVTSQATTLLLTNFYPLCPVQTIHDCFRNAPTSVQTNTYTVTVPVNDVAWFKLVPGVEQSFNAGTNDLTLIPWSSCYHDSSPNPISVNQWGDGYAPLFPYAVGNIPANGTNQTGMIFPLVQSNSVTWFIGGNGLTLNVQLGDFINNTSFNILGDGVSLWSGSLTDGNVTNLSLAIGGVDALAIVMTNNLGNPGYNTAYPVIGSPKVICNSQSVVAFDGTVKIYGGTPNASVSGITTNLVIAGHTFYYTNGILVNIQ